MSWEDITVEKKNHIHDLGYRIDCITVWMYTD